MIGNQRIIAVVQARMGSTRLPGKVLKPLAKRPVLWHVLERLRTLDFLDEIVVATSSKKENDQLEAFLRWLEPEKTRWLRGDEEDVLSRFAQAIEDAKVRGERPDLVVRVTADTPLLSTQHLEAMVEHLVASGCDGVDGHYEKTGLTLGFGTEVYRTEALLDAHREAERREEREHVSLFIKDHPERYHTAYLRPQEELISSHRLTLDRWEDYWQLENIYSHFYRAGKPVECSQALAWLRERGCSCCGAQEQRPLLTPRRQ